MSLRVWLPLTKDLRNQGLDDVTVTNNGATFNSAGKLGGSYTGRIDVSSSVIPTILNGSEFTVAFWIYINEVPTGSGVIDTYVMVCGTGGTRTQFHIAIRQNGAGFAFCFYSDDYTFYNTVTDKVGKWMHVVCAFKNNTQIVYVDGTKVGERATAGGLNVAVNSILYIYAAHERLNDFRIYDHAISPMEIKELSKGLVLHYPLNRQGFGQENLASQYIMPGGNKPGTTATNGRTNYYGDYGISIPATENADTYFSIWYSEPLESGATYTLSAEVSGLLSGSYYSFHLFAQDNTSMGIIKFNHNGLNTFTFTMNYTGTITTTTYNGKTYYRMFMDDVGRVIASGQGTITIKNIKLEKGSIATPWCPNSSDVLATTMGLNGTTEYDCSGFGNNGTRTGTFSWTSDTPKYTVSTYMPKAALITHPRPVFGGTDQEWTCAMWVKLDNVTQGSQAMNNFNISNNIVHSTTPLLYLNDGANDYYMYGSQAVSAGVWTHVVFVFKNNEGLRNIYINGVLKNNYGPNKTSIPRGIPDTVTVGTNLAGYISDYRIYATALSADDVKSLYQNSAYIDSSGNVYGTIHES